MSGVGVSSSVDGSASSTATGSPAPAPSARSATSAAAPPPARRSNEQLAVDELLRGDVTERLVTAFRDANCVSQAAGKKKVSTMQRLLRISGSVDAAKLVPHKTFKKGENGNGSRGHSGTYVISCPVCLCHSVGPMLCTFVT